MSFLTTQNIKDGFISYKGNTGGAGDTQFYQWINWIQEVVYPKLYAVNPNDYLVNRFIKTINDVETYTLPPNLETILVGGLYYTSQTSDGLYQALNYDAQSANFTVGVPVTGTTSGATGIIYAMTDYGTTGTLILSNVTGTFQDNELITSAGGSAMSNDVAILFDTYNDRMTETEFGSKDVGFWLDQTYLYSTPIPSTSEVYVFRYIPRLTSIASLGASTIFTDKYKEFVNDAIEVCWSMYRQDGNNEFMSSQRYKQALLDMLNTIKKTPKVSRIHFYQNLY